MANEKIKILSEMLEEIKSTHSYKEPQKPIVRKKLTIDEKIKFALDYYSLNDNTSLLDILLTCSDKNLERQIIEFMERYDLLVRYPNSQYDYLKNYDKNVFSDLKIKTANPTTIAKEYNHQNWLEIFDEDKIFEESRIKRPTYKYFPDKMAKPIKFDKEKAIMIKAAIISEDIIPARCIIEGAYPYFAKEEMPSYIEHVKILKGGK